MADVAKEAHVSVKTVSRVVNGEPGVRRDTELRVRGVIDRIGFLRQDGARVFRQGRNQTIALVVEDLANPFYSQMSAAVEREARIRQHQLIIASAEGSPTRERAVLEGLINRRVDGLIVVPAGEPSATDPTVSASGTPIIYVDRPVGGEPCDTVISDNPGGVRSAVEHLVAHGHRRIAFLGDSPEFWTARQRREAFVLIHDSLGLPGDTRVVMGPHTTESLAERLGVWARERKPVTAVITGNNRVTLAALHAMRQVDVHMGLVGYDDFELADLIEPAVTVVTQDPASIGQKAVLQLFARLLGDKSPAQTVVMPTRLIVRESGRLSSSAPRRKGHP